MRQRNLHLITLILCAVLLSTVSAFSIFAQDTPPEVPSTAPNNLLGALYQLRTEAVTNGWSVESHNRAAELWMQLGDAAQAAAHWESSLKLDGNQPDVLRQLGDFYVTSQQWTKAVDTRRAQIVLTPDDKTALTDLGLILAVYDKETAISHLQKIVFGPQVVTATLNLLNATPEPTPDLIELGLTFGSHERWDLAELAFREAVNISGDPSTPVAASVPEMFAYVGLARSNQGKEAEHWFTSAIAEEADNPQVWYIIGTYYRQQRQFEESINSFIYGFSFDQMNAFFPLQIAEVYEEMRNLTLAEVWFNEARMRSNDTQILERVNRFYADNAAMLSAVESIERLPNVATDLTPEIRASLGWILYTSGNEEAGLEEIERALLQNPDTPDALYYKANVLINRNQLAEARPLLEQIISSQNSFTARAQNLLDRLFP